MPSAQKNILADKDFYTLLNINSLATMSEIRSAYRYAALSAHPDKGGTPDTFHAISLAFETLSCPVARELYDRSRRFGVARCQQSCKPRSPSSVPLAARQRTSIPIRPFQSNLKARRRPCSGDIHDRCPAKRPSAARGDSNPCAGNLSRLFSALERLKLGLKEFPADRRRDAIMRLPMTVRRALLKYMTCPAKTCASRIPPRRPITGTFQRARTTDVRVIQTAYGTKYQAQLRMRALRMYTRAQSQLEMAIQVQMVFIQARSAIDSMGEKIWNEPNQFCKVFGDILKRNGTSEQELGLSVFVYMRADEWIDRTRTITSPILPLGDALVLHARLMEARATSWENLRAEWIPLLQNTQQAKILKMTAADAEAVADQARIGFLQRRIAFASRNVEMALTKQMRSAAKMKRLHVQEQRRIAKKRATEFNVRRLASKQRQELRIERLRWFRRADVTMEELRRGPPGHLHSV